MVLKGKVHPDSSRPELLHPVSSAERSLRVILALTQKYPFQVHSREILVSIMLQLNFVRFYLPLLDIENHERIIYLDDDVIVQGETDHQMNCVF